MPIKEGKEGPMPEDLLIKLIERIYRLCQWDIPVEGAIEIGKVVVDNYWRDKNAEQNKQKHPYT
jgi:hypothetical protein